jgi:hypothetical protein
LTSDGGKLAGIGKIIQRLTKLAMFHEVLLIPIYTKSKWDAER